MSDSRPDIRAEEQQAVAREASSHGQKWAAMHGGYFSDPAVAEPFLDEVTKATASPAPGALVDLGGGEGFLLRELLRRGVPAALKLVCLDLSPAQIACIRDPRITPVLGSITEFQRQSLADPALTFAWISRSTLHYAGLYGARSMLRHVRQQARPGEKFIHQTLCYETVDDALCASVIFEMIGSTKWIPPAGSLIEMMNACGWKTLRAAPAPMLPVTSEEMAERYSVSADRILYVREHLLRDFGEMPRVFEPTPRGFRWLGVYKTFTCEAV